MTQTDPVAELKDAGNRAHQRGQYRQAIAFFSRALAAGPAAEVRPVLHSNRAAAYCLFDDPRRALHDAEVAIQLRPDWAKGHSRLASALHSLRRYPEAIDAYRRALALEPGNAVVAKGLAEAEAAHAAHLSTMCSAALQPGTAQQLETCRALRQLPAVRWHLEILRDRIWLSDPPRPPFRPRSLFLIDSERLQLLNMSAHPVRQSISLDQLLSFLLDTCTKAGVRPSQVEVSDPGLQQLLAPSLEDLGIPAVVAPTAAKRQFFDDTVRSFEQAEQQQWASHEVAGKFEGVLTQRRQKGLLTVPGVTLPFLQAFMAAAARFLRSRTHLYHTAALGIRLEGEARSSVCCITRNPTGQYGIARAALPPAEASPEETSAFLLFCDASNIPFEDADLVDQQRWEVADDLYPLPLLGGVDPEVRRPPLEALEWFETALVLSTLFVSHTFAVPSFQPAGPLCYTCRVRTSRGPVVAIVSAPPSTDELPQGTLDDGSTPTPGNLAPARTPAPVPAP
eukprot:EG_transcript_10169